MKANYLFGPVASRRLGRSLGVDLIPAKSCPFDCVYCEVGRTTRHTTERKSYVPAEEVLGQLEEFFSGGGEADYVTFSGSGEPTLSADLGSLIRETKKRFGVSVAVITNGALLGDAGVRSELAEADVVIPSLDSARQESFEAVNRPVAGTTVGDIVDGLAVFVREFAGHVWLEVLLVGGVNDSDEDIGALVSAIAKIRPEKVQLNTIVRPPADRGMLPASGGRLEKAAEALCKVVMTEIVAPASARASGAAPRDVGAAILSTVSRRPCTAEDLAAGLSIPLEVVEETLGGLLSEGRVRKVTVAGGDYYEPAGKT